MIKEHSLKMKEWWLTFTKREQQVLMIGSGVTGFLLFYFAIWSPFLDRVSALREHIQKNQTTLAWMQAADKTIATMTVKDTEKKHTTPVLFLSFLQKQLKQTGLEKNLMQLKQASNEMVTLSFQKVEFDKLITFLMAVLRQQNVTIAQMAVSATEAQGIVTADIFWKLNTEG